MLTFICCWVRRRGQPRQRTRSLAQDPNRPFRAAARTKIAWGKRPDLNELGDTDPRSLSDLLPCFSLQAFSMPVTFKAHM